MPADVHEIRVPLDVSLGTRGSPVRRTDMSSLASGREHRNARHAHARRRYDAALGARTLDALHAELLFFEERRNLTTRAAFSPYSLLTGQLDPMRFGLLIATGALLGAAYAQEAVAQGAREQAPRECVSPREMPEIVAASGVVAPAAAIMTARRQVPNADVVRANLCWSERVLVYVIVVLRRDGRVVHVLIDGPSGQVKSVQ